MAEHPTTSRVEAVALVEGYVVLIERGPQSYGAYVPDLPGCIAVGDSAEEVVRMLRETLPAHLALMREAGETIPAPSSAPIPVAAE
ncbi:MAG: type II toxin-antitoxin system HicB family antitoxin [Chloroflexota bacterium]|nr:type II toxin-antitoxin system HicB family antitoxin [Chloroflexota bacterium]